MTQDAPRGEAMSAPDDLPGMLTVVEGTREQRWPHTMDAQVWVEKWRELKGAERATDDGAMIGWFANAIMAGFDTANMRGAEALSAQSAEITRLRAALRELRESSHAYTTEVPPNQGELEMEWSRFCKALLAADDCLARPTGTDQSGNRPPKTSR
jgi:hypothetical protein